MIKKNKVIIIGDIILDRDIHTTLIGTSLETPTLKSLYKDTKLNIGTVDKFQGQEAPITIISMTSSTVEDAPKGINFILNENRLNVAISRAQVAVFLFCSKGLFNAVGNSLNQMKLINKFYQIKKYMN